MLSTPPNFVLLIVVVAVFSACASGEHKRMKERETLIGESGSVYADWMETSPRLWSAGFAETDPSTKTDASGSVYIDYQNSRATGTGEFHTVKLNGSGGAPGSGLSVAWKITGMHIVTMTTSRSSRCANPKIAVFDGEFNVHTITKGHESREARKCALAVDLQGPGDAQHHTLTLNIAYPGVSIRDGIDEDGLVFVGSLPFPIE